VHSYIASGKVEIMTASSLEERSVLAIYLRVYMGVFMHIYWFLEYPLMGYNIIMGTDFMEKVPYEINLYTIVLCLPDSVLKGLDRSDRNCLALPSECVPKVDPASQKRDVPELPNIECQYLEKAS
jgi:hypothetical protein